MQNEFTNDELEELMKLTAGTELHDKFSRRLLASSQSKVYHWPGSMRGELAFSFYDSNSIQINNKKYKVFDANGQKMWTKIDMIDFCNWVLYHVAIDSKANVPVMFDQWTTP